MKKKKHLLAMLCLIELILIIGMFIVLGGPQKIKNQFLIRNGTLITNYEQLRVDDIYDNLSEANHEATIFYGDSQIKGFDWAEMNKNSNYLNRGVLGDTISGLINRIDQIESIQPENIVLQIGTNDLATEKDLNLIQQNYELLISSLKKNLPNSEIIITSIFPINEEKFQTYYPDSLTTNKKIDEMNQWLSDKFSNEPEISIININDQLTDNQGELLTKYTFDGLHLTYESYNIWNKKLANEL